MSERNKRPGRFLRWASIPARTQFRVLSLEAARRMREMDEMERETMRENESGPEPTPPGGAVRCA